MSHYLSPNTWAPRALAILRIVTGYCLMLHGTAKHLKIPRIEAFEKIDPLSMSGIAGWIELIGGGLLIIGLFSRPVAFLLSGLMAFAYFLGHALPQGSWLLPLINRGEAAVLFCFITLYISAAGPGSWSLDGIRARRAR
ncbi:MAG: DoxX family protein [Burkholderiaceae bacterium]